MPANCLNCHYMPAGRSEGFQQVGVSARFMGWGRGEEGERVANSGECWWGAQHAEVDSRQLEGCWCRLAQRRTKPKDKPRVTHHTSVSSSSLARGTTVLTSPMASAC